MNNQSGAGNSQEAVAVSQRDLAMRVMDESQEEQ